MMIQKIHGETDRTNVLRRISTEYINTNVPEKRMKKSDDGNLTTEVSQNEPKSRKKRGKQRKCFFCPKRDSLQHKRTRGSKIYFWSFRMFSKNTILVQNNAIFALLLPAEIIISSSKFVKFVIQRMILIRKAQKKNNVCPTRWQHFFKSVTEK